MRATMKSSAGFTLIELIITVAIVAILAGVVAPGMTSFIRDNRMTSQINTLIGTVHYARAEAANRRAIITLCASTDAANCNTDSWESGWILFSDNHNNGNAIIDGTDELILAQEALDGGNTLREAGFNFADSGRLQFNARGFLYANAPTSGTLTLCDERGDTHAKALIVNIAGVTRLATDESTTPDGIVNNHLGNLENVSCP